MPSQHKISRFLVPGAYCAEKAIGGGVEVREGKECKVKGYQRNRCLHHLWAVGRRLSNLIGENVVKNKDWGRSGLRHQAGCSSGVGAQEESPTRRQSEHLEG